MLLWLKQCNVFWQQDMGGRGAIPDKWSMRVLWVCALGSAVGMHP